MSDKKPAAQAILVPATEIIVPPRRQEYRLKAPLIQAGIELAAGATVQLHPAQAERLRARGII